MKFELQVVSWRFLGGSEWIEQATVPPSDIREEVEEARSLLFRGYPRILPNLSGQFCPAARAFQARGKAWIDVPLRQSGLRMLAIYFVYQSSRSFWNGLELVYEPTGQNSEAVSHLMAYTPAKQWELWQILPHNSGEIVSIWEAPGARRREQAEAFNFPLRGQDSLYSGVVPEDWMSFVCPEPQRGESPDSAESCRENDSWVRNKIAKGIQLWMSGRKNIRDCVQRPIEFAQQLIDKNKK